jgi:hypothetical protein
MKMVTPPNFANLLLCCAANNAKMQVLQRTMEQAFKTRTDIHLHTFKIFNGSKCIEIVELGTPISEYSGTSVSCASKRRVTGAPNPQISVYRKLRTRS